MNFREVEVLAGKLKEMQDKTHFHIDKRSVSTPEKVWEDANLTGDCFSGALDKLWIVLNSLYTARFGREFGQPIYDALDIESIIEAVSAQGIKI